LWCPFCRHLGASYPEGYECGYVFDRRSDVLGRAFDGGDRATGRASPQWAE
jgi:hypothetical protein